MPYTDQELRVLSERAVDLLEKLIMTEELPKGTETLPRKEVIHSKALMFLFMKKIGIAASIETGYGFVIAQRPGANGVAEWSAPLFITSRSAGVGITLGISEIKSISVLRTDAAVDLTLKFQVGVNADAQTTLGKSDGEEVPGVTFGNPVAVKDIDTYAFRQGHILDYSLRGVAMNLDHASNTALYGSVDPAAVLNFSTPRIKPFESLYTALDKVRLDYKQELISHAADKKMLSGPTPQLHLFDLHKKP